MKLVLKIGAGLLIALVLLAVGAFATLYLKAPTPEHPVGFAEIAIKDPQDKPLQVDIWYPTDSPSGLSIIGPSAQRVATKGVVAGRSLPLVVISHGNGGLASSHSDTALALLPPDSSWLRSRTPATTPGTTATLGRLAG